MPIFNFSCSECNNNWEDLVLDLKFKPFCSNCGSFLIKKLASSFSGSVKGSPNRKLDVIIGEQAEKKWEKIHERKEKRSKKVK